MRKIEFEVPQSIMADFAGEISIRNLTNTITGTTANKRVVIEIEFEKEESELVDELEEIFDDINEE
jgi:hypothetical protein